MRTLDLRQSMATLPDAAFLIWTGPRLSLYDDALINVYDLNDFDRDGYDAGSDCDEEVATCNTDCLTDADTDTLRDCDDACLDIDGDDGQWISGGRITRAGRTALRTLEENDIWVHLVSPSPVLFGEMLAFRRLMEEERSPKVRLALLCGKLEDTFATVFRQVAMTRFEERLHAARRGEGELPSRASTSSGWKPTARCSATPCA